jgi:photosystem II stability/assembly factor-like uncharacterized protein
MSQDISHGNVHGNGRHQSSAAAAREEQSSAQAIGHRLHNLKLDPGLHWRSIGPFRGGRVVAVAGDPANPYAYYFGSTGGGVWKTTDGAHYWENVSDRYFKRASVGAIAVARADPNVVYVGMGEATIRGNVSHGDGVYKSTDGGTSWRHLGLADTRNIGKVRVHPENPDIIYVAALGHAHGPNAERGIFRSMDGGATWRQVLFRGEDAGANDLSMDPHNPRILYATFWRARRYPHQLVSGGEGCALVRSTDGGETWTELTHHKGLPKGMVGKMGVAVSPARSGRVWATIEAEEGGVFRSDDSGETWERLCADRGLQQRPWYYQHIVADPQDGETVWILNVRLWRSSDGGRSFARMAIPHGDHHDLWIDPGNNQRLIEGNDGGACVTADGGRSWSSIYNQPTAEFYHVTTDQQIPYRVYGAQQDNSTISVPSRSDSGAITQAVASEIGGGESGYIAVHPRDPHIIYAGSYQGYLSRYDGRTQQRRNVTIWPEAMMGHPARDCKYRFQWTFPIMLSPHDPSVVYVGGNHVFRSTNEGTSWDEISPDLTRNDASRLQDSGGPLTLDNCGTEYYGTVFALAESPIERGLLWAGSDDGLVHVSRDGGGQWERVAPEGLPEWSLISIIEPSPHSPAVAYLAANRYKHDDFAPYLFKTDDYGKHWTAITHGLPTTSFARVIREDPERRGLLFAGTETGVYVTFDDGRVWRPLQLNLPVVPIHDLVVKGSDLVLATHGRSFWILDDITPLRQLDEARAAQAAYLFQPRPAIKWGSGGGGRGGSPVPGMLNYQHTDVGGVAFKEVTRADGESETVYLDAGANPHDGVYITYLLNEKPEGELTLTFCDTEGREIRSYSSEERKQRIAFNSDARNTTGEGQRERPEPKAPKGAGLNRFYWDMRLPDARPVEGYVIRGGVVEGPTVPPGRYQVRFTLGEHTQSTWFEIQKDPRSKASQEDLEEQFKLLLRIRDKVSQTHEAIDTLQAMREQVAQWLRRSEGALKHDEFERAGEAVTKQACLIEDELIERRTKEDDDTLRYPVRLNFKLAELYGVVGSADACPTRQAHLVFDELSAQVDRQLDRMRDLVEREVAEFNRLVREAGTPAIVASAALAVQQAEPKAVPARTQAGESAG